MIQVQRVFFSLPRYGRRFQHTFQHFLASGEGVLTPNEKEVEQVQPLL